MPEARLTAELPERYGRLYDYRAKKFETPLDSQGIADIDAVFELAILTYPDELPDFTKAERNVHHIYWTESYWRYLASQHDWPEREIIQTFRESTPQKAYVPLEIHKWIEDVMYPPPPPPIEIMDRRNAAWKVATKLLESALLLDKARSDYDENKDSTRLVLGKVEGHTPRSQQHDFEMMEVSNRDYWLSELNRRLEGWRLLSGMTEITPVEETFIPEPRLWAVRALKSRINAKHKAIEPRLPELIAA